MKKICIHWTAGPYAETNADYQHYHYTVGPEGIISKGKFLPEANIPPLKNGQYAAHCGGGNSYCIGIAMRGMAGFKNSKSVGNYPLTAKQCEVTWEYISKLCKRYRIPVGAETVFTHYEFGKKNPESDSRGKIDIIYLPHEPKLKADEIGNYIRNKVEWYLRNVE